MSDNGKIWKHRNRPSKAGQVLGMLGMLGILLMQINHTGRPTDYVVLVVAMVAGFGAYIFLG